MTEVGPNGGERAAEQLDFVIWERPGTWSTWVRGLVLGAATWGVLADDAVSPQRYEVRVVLRHTQEQLGAVEAGDEPAAASGLRQLLLEAAEDLTVEQFLARYHLDDDERP